jgi:cysteine desulfurase
MSEHYLDNSATTRVFPEVVEQMNRIFLEEYGNPSSMHHKGVEAEKEIRRAGETLAGILKCEPSNLVYTSCGSESDNLAIIGAARAYGRRGKHLITTRIEHEAVLESMKYLEGEGYEITYLPVDSSGLVDPQDVRDAVRDDTILVSVMHTNNEIGALEPIAEIGAAVKEKNPQTLFHVDAVQAFGKARIYPKKMNIDLLAASGHKIHGPKGMGLLYVADGVRLMPIILGGGQQNGLRSGTHNVPGIVGMSLAAKMLYDDLDTDIERLRSLKNHFIERIGNIPDVRVNGSAGPESAPHIISLSVRGIPCGSASACAGGQESLCVFRQRLCIEPAAYIRNPEGDRLSFGRPGQYNKGQHIRHEYNGGHGCSRRCAAGDRSHAAPLYQTMRGPAYRRKGRAHAVPVISDQICRDRHQRKEPLYFRG